MAKFETWLKTDLKKAPNTEYLDGEFFMGDSEGNLIGVEVYKDGEAVTDLTGNVTGYIVRADGATITQNGTWSSNRASINLPTAAYNIEGPITISIKIAASGVVTTLASIKGHVHRTQTDTIVDPGSTVSAVASVNTYTPDAGGNVTIPSITNAEIDTILSS